jgi:hypothetical protein
MPALSKAQQRLMGTAYSVKKGDSKINDVDPKYRDTVRDLIDSMTLKQLKDFAETKHEGLPDRVDETGLHANPNMNVPGIGAVELPGDPGSIDGFSSQRTGSGDLPTPLGKKKKKKKRIIMTFEQFIIENILIETKSDPIKMWNEYMKLVDILDGIISEHGELSNSYWKSGAEDRLNELTAKIRTVSDIENNRNQIINSFKELMDGLNGWMGGHDVSRYGRPASIKVSVFK